MPVQILDCDLTQTTLQGSSTSTTTSLMWNSPNASIISSSLTVSANANITQTLVNTYTFVVTDLNNYCKSNTVIPIYQNLFPPTASVITGGMYIITCSTPTIVLVNTSSSGIPPFIGFPINLPVVAIEWRAPVQPSLGLSTTYAVSTGGTYTMTVKDLNNGCLAAATVMLSGDCNLVGLNKNTMSNLSVTIFPNPAHDAVTLVIEGNQTTGTLEVFNALGKLVLKQDLVSQETQINVSNLSRGVYILNIMQQTGYSHTSKFIKD